jgi:hypothetical protein
MKNLSKKKEKELDTCWKNIITMWKDIVYAVERFEYTDINELKRGWLAKHGFDDIEDNCFFCEWAENNKDRDSHRCHKCPGVLVDEEFNCGDDPAWDSEPIEFYKLLKKLDRKRKRQLKKMKG